MHERSSDFVLRRNEYSIHEGQWRVGNGPATRELLSQEVGFLQRTTRAFITPKWKFFSKMEVVHPTPRAIQRSISIETVDQNLHSIGVMDELSSALRMSYA